jgi:hypothetical protein
VRRTRNRFITTLAASAAVAVVAIVAVAQASVIADLDLDPSMSPFHSQTQGAGQAVTLTTSPACDGNASKHTLGVSSSTARSQLDGGPYNHQPGKVTYTKWSTFLPTNYPATKSWLVFFQFHGEPYSGSPPVSMNIDSAGRAIMELHTDGGSKKIPWVGSAAMAKGVWTDFVIGQRSEKSTAGWVELYVNGVQQPLKTGSGSTVMRLPHKTVAGNMTNGTRIIPTHYTGAGHGGTLYHDEIFEATSLSDVLDLSNCRPGAEPPPPSDTAPTSVDFAISDQSVTPGEPVTFTAGPVTGGEAPYVYEWYDVANGALLGTGQSYTRTQGFASEGTKHIRLIVKDENGGTGAESLGYPAGTTAATHDHAYDVVVSAADTTPPNPPSNLAVTDTNCDSDPCGVSLSWDVVSDATLYRIERAVDGGSFELLADTTETAGGDRAGWDHFYDYRVRALDAAGNVSAPSNTVRFTAPVTPDTAPTATFTVSDQSIAPGEQVTFTATVQGGEAPYVYSWYDLNTGSCSTPTSCPLGSTNPLTRSFSSTGTKHVHLKVTDENGAGESYVVPHDHALHDVVVQ